jgi:hypothetical protein
MRHGPPPKYTTRRRGSVAAWPVAARAQQPALPVIGVLHATSLTYYEQFDSFARGSANPD